MKQVVLLVEERRKTRRVAHHVQIEVPVVVVVAPGSAHVVGERHDPRRFGHVAEVPGSVVLIEAVWAVIRHVEVLVAVVVVVGEHRAEPGRAVVVDPACHGLLGEVARAVVDPKLSRIGAPGDVQVEIPVAVDIPPGGPGRPRAAHRLADRGIEARLRGDILELGDGDGGRRDDERQRAGGVLAVDQGVDLERPLVGEPL